MKQPGKRPAPDPTAKKLGIKPGMQLLILGTPRPYAEFFTELPAVEFLDECASGKAGFIHLFAKTFTALEQGLEKAVSRLEPDGMVWVSWPKKASGIPSEIGKMDVLYAGQAIGLVDIKVAALDKVWSGHKFVIPLADRQDRATV